MDVTCNRCGIVYEFEEALISTTGTTVKCTQCGHLFKVHRSVEPALSAADLLVEAPRWRVRRVDGSIHTLDSLADLTQLISVGQFGADDEISRTGQIWKRLGGVAELTALFERSARPRRLSEPPLPPPPEPQLDLTTDNGEVTVSGGKRRRRLSHDLLFHEPEVPLPRVTMDPPAERARVSDLDEPTADSMITASHLPLPHTPSVASSPSALPPPTAPSSPRSSPLAPPTPDRLPSTLATLGEEVPLPMSTRSGVPARALAIGAVLLLAGGLGTSWLLNAGAITSAKPEAAAANAPPTAVRRGDEALAAHRIERFDEAIAAYTEALAQHPDDPHILSSLSRVYAVWCDWLQFRVRALRQRSDREQAQAQLDELLAQTRKLTEEAKRHGERAAQRNPGNEEAGVALSDALRLSGNLVAARAELDRARATQRVAQAETLRVAALLAIDEADSDVRAGRKLAEQAVAQDPSLIRTRLLLARCLADDGDAAGAETQLAAVRQIDPTHPLPAEIAAAAQVAHDKAAAASAATRTHDGGVAVKDDSPAPAPTPTPRKPSESETNDPLELVRRGEAALERGNVPLAQRTFDRALAIDPDLARAHTGLGYVALERNQPVIAISQYRLAAARNDPDALIGLGDAYRKLGRKRDALDAYRGYLKRYPKGDRRSIAQHQSELLTEQLENAH